MENPNLNLNKNSNQPESINLRDIIFKYLRKWYWFAISIVIVVSLALLYLKYVDVKYEVQSTILLRNNSNSGISQITMLESFGLSGLSKEVEDEIQILGSKKLIRQVIDSLQIQVDYYEKKGLRYIDKYNNSSLKIKLPDQLLDTLTYGINFSVQEKNGYYKVNISAKDRFKVQYNIENIQQTIETPVGQFHLEFVSPPKANQKYKIKIHSINNLIEDYATKLKVSTVNKKTNAIRLSIVESNQPKAKDFLNSIVKHYNAEAIYDKNIIAQSTAEFIKVRLQIITEELFDVERDVENYKKTNSLTDLSSEARLYLASASSYEKTLMEIETKLNLIKSVETYIDDPQKSEALIPSNIITDDASLTRAIQEYNLAVRDMMRLSRTATKQNPSYLMLEEQINALRANVRVCIANVRKVLLIMMEDVKKQEKLFNSKIKNVPTQERQYIEIKRQQEIKQALYLFLSQKREETALNLASTAPAARTIDTAFASLKPVSPKASVILFVALILGCMIPFICIYLKDLLNNKIDDSKIFQRDIQAPFLGRIAKSDEHAPIVVKEDKTTPIVEMFRLIRANLLFIQNNSKPSNVILVTSTVPGEGKSFISINLAMSLALMKKRTLLIGMDIRSPMLVEYLSLKDKSEGLTIYLADESKTLDDVIVNSGCHTYLDVIPAGPVPPNPGELLLSPRLDTAIEKLREQYEYIIVDTAPVGVVSDTYLLNRITDNVLYVARLNYTHREAVALINEIYSENRLTGLGVILNGTSSAASGYGYGYGAKNKKKERKTFSLSTLIRKI